RGIAWLPSSSWRNEQCRESVLIKALYQLTNALSAFISCFPGCISKGLSCPDSQERSCSFYHIQTFTGGFSYAVQFLLFGRCKSSQRMVLCFPHVCLLSPENGD